MTKKRERTPAERLAQLDMLNWILAQHDIVKAVKIAHKKLGDWQWDDSKTKWKDSKNDGVYDDPMFRAFWKLYPKKVGKGDALKSWKKIKPSATLADKICRSVEAQLTSKEWRKDEGSFIPNPATYLNQRRFDDLDDVGEEKPKPKVEHVYDKERDCMVAVPVTT